MRPASGRERGRLDPVARRILERPVDLLVPEQVGDGDRGVGQVAGEARGVGRLRHPRGYAGHHAGRVDPLGDDLGREEAVLDEVAQGLAELVLARRG